MKAFWRAPFGFPGALQIGLSALFLLCGYEFIRSSSSTLYKASFGKENLPVIMALMPIGLAIGIYIYARVLSAFGPRKTLLTTSAGSFALLVCCYFGIVGGYRVFSGILYIVREVYVILLIEQYWSFLNSALSESQAKTFNGPICGISSIGAIIGDVAVSQLAIPWGTNIMVIIGAMLVIPAACFSDLAYRRSGEMPTARLQPVARQTQDHLGLGLFREQPMLVLLFMVICLTQVVSALTSLSFEGMLQDIIPHPDQQTAYSGAFFGKVNGLACVMQFLIAPVLLRKLPITVILVAIPLVHIASCSYFVLLPSLQSAGMIYLLFKVLDYSLFRASKEMLYIPFSFDIRFRAKEIIDVFGYRFSKGGTSLVVVLVQKMGMMFSEVLFGAVAGLTSFCWVLLIVPLVRQFRSAKLKAESSTLS